MAYNFPDVVPLFRVKRNNSIKSLFVNNFDIRQKSIILLSTVIHYNGRRYDKDQIMGGI